MISKLLDILSSIIHYFLNFKKEKKIEEVEAIRNTQEKVEFISEIESIAKKAESIDPDEKARAIEEMRRLISE